MLVLCCFTGSRLGTPSASAFSTERIDSLAVTNESVLDGVIIAANGASHNRDTLDVRVQTYFSRSGLDAPTSSYVVVVSLMNSSGDPHPIYNQQGVSSNNYAVYFPVSLAMGGSRTVTNHISLRPVTRLDPYDTYYVDVELYEWVGSPHFYTRRDDEQTTSQMYFHFNNTNPNDAAYNVIAALMGCTVARAYAVKTAPLKTAYIVNVPYTLLRFDAFSAGPSSTNIPVDFDAELVDAAAPETPIPLKSVTHLYPTREMFAYDAVAPVPDPYQSFFFDDSLLIEPADGVQLDSVAAQYVVKVRIKHRDSAATNYTPGNLKSTVAQNLLHFNGALRFGAVTAIMTNITNHPAWEGLVGGSVATRVSLGTGGAYISGFPQHEVSSSGSLDVLLDTNGIATVIGGVATVGAPVPDTGAVANVRFSRTNIVLNASGASAEVKVILPAGMGWATNASSKTANPFLTFPGIPLDASLRPNVNAVVNETRYYSEETKPLLFESAWMVWTPSTGRFELHNPVAHYVRTQEIHQVEQNFPPVVDTRSRLSNELLYRSAGVKAGTKVVISPRANGSAQLEAELTLGASEFAAHFPLGGVRWSHVEASELIISNSLINPQRSLLKGCTSVVVYCEQGCGAQQDCSGGAGFAYLKVNPTGAILRFTADGGLWGSGAFTHHLSTNKTLSWGASADGQFAHSVGNFTNANFFMPGHFLGSQAGSIPIPSRPAAMLLEGVLTNNLASFERYGSAAYTNGLGDYAGVNLRMTNHPLARARSRIGGVLVSSYPLTTRSKYYARQSGVNGIHEDVPGGFPGGLTIYGYPFTFSKFGLSYLSGDTHDSRTQGNVVLPYPSGFTQEFSRLKLTCVGDLSNAEVPAGSPDKLLQYWNAKIKPLGLLFKRNDNGNCNPGTGSLAMPVVTHVAHISEPLVGVLGFEPGGDLISAAAGIAALDSRLSAPNAIRLAGPTNKPYSFTCVSKAYFNDYSLAAAGDKDPGEGYVSLAGSMDLPFFDNALVHLHTSADTNSITAPVYLAGGWPQYGWKEGDDSFFNSATFDSTNRGAPASASLNGYRVAEEQFRPRAKKAWIPGITFDFPLRWNSASRVFKSYEPTAMDLAVVEAQGRVGFMTPTDTKISFTSQTNEPSWYVSTIDACLQKDIAHNEDEAADFFECLGSNVVRAINMGREDLAYALSDNPAKLFDQALSDLLRPVMLNLAGQLRSPANYDAAKWNTLVAQYVSGGPGAPAANVRARLPLLINNPDPATTGLVERLDWVLRRVGWLTDAMARQVRYDPLTGASLASPENGILYEDPQGAMLLADYLLQFMEDWEWLHDLFALVAQAGLQGKVETLLEVKEMAFAGLRGHFAGLSNQVEQTRTRLEGGGEINEELQAALPSDVVAAITDAARNALTDYLLKDVYPTYMAADWTDQRLADAMLAHVQRAFHASSAAAGIQASLRRHFYDLNAAVEHDCGAVFQELNDVIFEVVSDLLEMADEQLKKFLGDKSSYGSANQLSGYADIKDDSLHELRIDGQYQLGLINIFDLKFKGYLLIKALQSEGEQGGTACPYPGGKAMEVTLVAEDVSMPLPGKDVKATVNTHFTFAPDPFEPLGLSGGFKLTSGKILLPPMEIGALNASLAFGQEENYLAGKFEGKTTGDDVSIAGGLFAGRACSLEPLKQVDEDVAAIVKAAPFFGIYAYGEGTFPVIPLYIADLYAGFGCGFLFLDNMFGQTLLMRAKAKILRIVTVTGEIKLVAAKGYTFSLDDVSFLGRGKIIGCIDLWLTEVCGHLAMTLTYLNGDWDLSDPDIGYGK
ncbi:MAG: hypothetical protein KA248_06835 [Kiritimatiellae bacterium]|nr:hypothetical protein [Kiritimatiellia bacterium]